MNFSLRCVWLPGFYILRNVNEMDFTLKASVRGVSYFSPACGSTMLNFNFLEYTELFRELNDENEILVSLKSLTLMQLAVYFQYNN